MLDIIGAMDSNFNFHNHRVTGIEAMIYQSDETANNMIAAFEAAIENGYHPLQVEQQIYQQFNPDDLLDSDKNRVNRKVSEIWAAHKGEFDEYA